MKNFFHYLYIEWLNNSFYDECEAITQFYAVSTKSSAPSLRALNEIIMSKSLVLKIYYKNRFSAQLIFYVFLFALLHAISSKRVWGTSIYIEHENINVRLKKGMEKFYLFI